MGIENKIQCILITIGAIWCNFGLKDPKVIVEEAFVNDTGIIVHFMSIFNIDVHLSIDSFMVK